jgi:hypothetical protein
MAETHPDHPKHVHHESFGPTSHVVYHGDAIVHEAARGWRLVVKRPIVRQVSERERT